MCMVGLGEMVGAKLVGKKGMKKKQKNGHLGWEVEEGEQEEQEQEK